MRELLRAFLNPFNLFSRPSALKLASDELDESQRELLRAQSALDYARCMTEYHQDRIKRLSAFVKAALDQADRPRHPTDRKFNRMRPSMARVLGLETRSAKEG